MTQVRKDVAFFPGVNTEFDWLGDASKFGIEIVKASDGSVATNDGAGTWEGIMWTDPGHTGKTSGVAAAGSSVITLASGNTLVAGDRFDDGAGNLYYVVKGSDTEITIKRELKADIADATDLNSVGNTGSYKVEVKLADVGEYFVSFSHPEFGHKTIKYEIVEHNLDETFTRLDEGLDKLGASGSMSAII